MLQVILYFAIAAIATIVGIGLIGVTLLILIGYRKKNYHNFVVRQYKFQDNEYDRIYGNG
ncbi:MAG: hypothetical protein WBI74_04835 [Caldicoprobacterales bacterium]